MRACSYRVGSVTPQARLWTMTIYDRTGALAARRNSDAAASPRRRSSAGPTMVSISSCRKDLSAGNWLQVPTDGAFTLVLRLYDMPGAAGANLDADDLPTIERVACGP